DIDAEPYLVIYCDYMVWQRTEELPEEIVKTTRDNR
ncbi:MAG: hypothetical protein UW22_C0069G0012, partial [Candidatus Gottesmanbacteria bacterium GW2011_GWB1_44_11c]